MVRSLPQIGAWRSLVARLLWEQEVGGSNPLAPTNRTGSGGTRFIFQSNRCSDRPFLGNALNRQDYHSAIEKVSQQRAIGKSLTGRKK
jgi:hypothetical protein